MSDVASLRQQLTTELREQESSAFRVARAYGAFATLCKIVAIGASLAGGVLGILKQIPAEFVGVIALVPGGAALAAQQLQLQGKSNAYYLMAERLRGIRSRLVYSGLECDNPGALAFEAAGVRTQFTKDWQNAFSYDWNELTGRPQTPHGQYVSQAPVPPRRGVADSQQHET